MKMKPYPDLSRADRILLFATKLGDASAVAEALDGGGSIEVRDKNGYTPLMVAIVRQSESIVKLLVSRGANVNAQTEHYKLTPLHLAVGESSTAISQVLLEHGADIHALGWHKCTPLHVACMEGKLDQIKV